MLDEVIEYLKQLQAQVQMMNNARLMPQIIMPLGVQQHLQMSLLARMGMGLGMGMGMGMGMLDTTSIAHGLTPSQAAVPQLIHPTQVTAAASGFMPPAAFVVPQMVPTAVSTQQQGPDQGASTSASLQDPYSTFLAQASEFCILFSTYYIFFIIFFFYFILFLNDHRQSQLELHSIDNKNRPK